MKKIVNYFKNVFKKKQKENTETYSSSGRPKREFKHPVCLCIKNTSDQQRRAVLFGEAVHGNAKNFGSQEGIEVYSQVHQERNDSYIHILKESAYKPFKIGMIRIISENHDNLRKELNYENHTGDGSIYFTPMKITLDPMQFQNGIVDIRIIRKIDCNSYLSLVLEPRSELVFLVYPLIKEAPVKEIKLTRWQKIKNALK